MTLDITTILAVYGAFLSTVVFLWEIARLFRERPNLKVQAHRGFQASPIEGSFASVFITVVNTGKEPLTIVASGFRFNTKSDENTGTVADPDLPKELTQGQSHRTYVNPDELESRKVIYAWARDATGKVWRSRRYPLR